MERTNQNFLMEKSVTTRARRTRRIKRGIGCCHFGSSGHIPSNVPLVWSHERWHLSEAPSCCCREEGSFIRFTRWMQTWLRFVSAAPVCTFTLPWPPVSMCILKPKRRLNAFALELISIWILSLNARQLMEVTAQHFTATLLILSTPPSMNYAAPAHQRR